MKYGVSLVLVCLALASGAVMASEPASWARPQSGGTTRATPGVDLLVATAQPVAWEQAPLIASVPMVPVSVDGKATSSTIWVQQDLRETVQEALTLSPTFRAQVRELEHRPNVHVAIVVDERLVIDEACRAQGVIRVYSSGLIFARITLSSSVINVPELVAHELEHVRERLEGFRVTMAFARKVHGTTRLVDGRYETERALKMGRRVRDEVEKGHALLTRNVTR